MLKTLTSVRHEHRHSYSHECHLYRHPRRALKSWWYSLHPANVWVRVFLTPCPPSVIHQWATLLCLMYDGDRSWSKEHQLASSNQQDTTSRAPSSTYLGCCLVDSTSSITTNSSSTPCLEGASSTTAVITVIRSMPARCTLNHGQHRRSAASSKCPLRRLPSSPAPSKTPVTSWWSSSSSALFRPITPTLQCALPIDKLFYLFTSPRHCQTCSFFALLYSTFRIKIFSSPTNF